MSAQTTGTFDCGPGHTYVTFLTKDFMINSHNVLILHILGSNAKSLKSISNSKS